MFQTFIFLFFKFKFKLDYRYWACLCSWYIFFGIKNVWTKRMKTKRKQSCKYRDYGTDLCIPRVINAMAHGKTAILAQLDSWPNKKGRGRSEQSKGLCSLFVAQLSHWGPFLIHNFGIVIACIGLHGIIGVAPCGDVFMFLF